MEILALAIWLPLGGLVTVLVPFGLTAGAPGVKLPVYGAAVFATALDAFQVTDPVV